MLFDNLPVYLVREGKSAAIEARVIRLVMNAIKEARNAIYLTLPGLLV